MRVAGKNAGAHPSIAMLKNKGSQGKETLHDTTKNKAMLLSSQPVADRLFSPQTPQCSHRN